MKIDKNLFAKYLKKVSVNKRVKMCLLNFTEDGLTTRAVDDQMYILVKSKLVKENFAEYEPLGEIAIKDTEFLQNMVKVFEGLITIKIKKNLFMVQNEKNTKSVATTLVAKEAISQTPKEIGVKFKNTPFNIETVKLQSAIGDIVTLFGKEEKQMKEITLLSKGDGYLHIITKDSRENKLRISSNVMTEQFRAKFADTILSDVIGSLTENQTQLTVQSDFPLKIVEKGKIETTYLIAPRIES